MKTDSYIQFPLCLLSYGSNVKTRMHAIMTSAAVTAGLGYTEKQTAEFIAERFAESILPSELEDVYECGDNPYCHKEIVIGMHILKLNLSRDLFVSMTENPWAVRQFCYEMEQKHGKCPLVRIKAAYAEEVLNRSGMSYRDFSILCAIYSIIGSKEYSRITRDQIRARSMGYKSATALFSKDSDLTENGQKLLNEREDHAKPLTTDQIRYTLDRLETGHFARVVAGKREVFFSHRMNRVELSETICGLKTDRSTKLVMNRLADIDLQSRIKDILRPHIKTELVPV